jgi:poly(glycerol-phosphate) alpha-glucosyltransferase
MTIAFLNSSISSRGGGIFEIERRLAQSLIKIDNVSIDVIGLEDDKTAEDRHLWLPLKPKSCKRIGPSSFGFSRDLISSIKETKADLLHLHSLWLYTSIAAFRSSMPYVTTINGMLDEWAVRNSFFKKKIVYTLYEKKALESASCLQANTEKEYIDIRKFGLKNPVCIIPNGVDLPNNIDILKQKMPPWKSLIDKQKKVLLYLGRIHPKKGLTNLIRAWKQVSAIKKSECNEWALVIAGWDQGGYEEELIQLTNELKLNGSVWFLGPQFNENKQLILSHANAFILPSFSEGMPMAILEAWAYNLPVLMTPQCNLTEGFSTKAAIEIQTSIHSIAENLNLLFSLPVCDLEKMGNAGNNLVKQKFSWTSVAFEMHKVYQWVIGKNYLPDNIILK